MKIVITEEQYVSIVSSLDEVSSANIWNKERFENLLLQSKTELIDIVISNSLFSVKLKSY